MLGEEFPLPAIGGFGEDPSGMTWAALLEGVIESSDAAFEKIAIRAPAVTAVALTIESGIVSDIEDGIFSLWLHVLLT